jgi:hypothetical protein
VSGFSRTNRRQGTASDRSNSSSRSLKPAQRLCSSFTAETWLPLTYEYTITSNGGVRRHVEYRLSDGSVRWDSLDIDEVRVREMRSYQSVGTAH